MKAFEVSWVGAAVGTAVVVLFVIDVAVVFHELVALVSVAADESFGKNPRQLP